MPLPTSLVLLLLIVFLGMTILVHELGHFLSARLLGLVVETFSIGFGPALWKRTHRGIVYKIGWIPFGGYVAIPQIDPSGMNRIQTPERPGLPATALPPAPAWKKIVVSLSGACGNVLLAMALAWIVYAVGMPQDFAATVGYVEPSSEAYAQGLRIADRVRAVNGRTVRTWREVRMEVALVKEAILEAAAPDGTLKTLRLRTEKGLAGERAIPGVSGPSLCKIEAFLPESPARQAGLRTNDVILAVNGQTIYSPGHVRLLIQEARETAVALRVRRPRERQKPNLFDCVVHPRWDAEAGEYRLGVRFGPDILDMQTVTHPAPSEQLRDHATAIFRVLTALIDPRTAGAAQAAVGGPVAVISGIWYFTRVSLIMAVWFMGFLNINLAIINLLPIPVLDGGHILFALWEAGTRRPVPEPVARAVVNAFLVLLIGLFVFLVARDVDRLTPIGARIRRAAAIRQPRGDTNAVPEPTGHRPPMPSAGALP